METTELLSEAAELSDMEEEGAENVSEPALFALSDEENGFNISVTGVLQSYTGSETDVVIPEGVTAIGDGAFAGKNNITSVVIPEGVTSIGKSAFYNCYSMRSVTIPNSVTSIGESAFKECRVLNGVTLSEGLTSIGNQAFYNCDQLVEMTIPEGVTSIGESVFYSCENLTEVILPEGLTDINYRTFYCCTKLTSVTIPESVTYIGVDAFYCCTKLKNVSIPSGVTSIGEHAFYECNSMVDIALPAGLESMGSGIFENSGLRTVTIPEGIMRIGNRMFYNCNLLNVTLPSSVTEIGSYAFSYNGLSGMKIPESVTSIGSYAFSNCSLTTISLPTALESIPEGMFYYCTGLTGIVIPENVTSIEKEAFAYCWNLESQSLSERLESIGESAFDNCNKLAAIRLPSTVKSIGRRAFASCDSLASIAVPEGVTLLGEQAFYGCTALVRATLPSTLESIEKNAFGYCQKLSRVTIPEGVAAIGEEAFSSCSALKTVTIPSSVKSIGKNAFNNCDALAEVILSMGLTEIGDKAFYDCNALAEADIPEGVTSIGASAFYNCPLKEMAIPEGVISVGNEAFRDCIYLGSVSIPSSLKEIYNSVFLGCRSLEEVTIPEGVEVIWGNAFQNCTGLKGISIPASVTRIAASAFSGCTGLVDVVLPEGVASIGEQAFAKCRGLKTISIPASMTGIGTNAFMDCGSLTDICVAAGNPLFESYDGCLYDKGMLKLICCPGGKGRMEIPAGVTNIGARAFINCTALSSIIIPEDIISIGDYAFSGCSNLKRVEIVEGAASIGKQAFYNCESLKAIAVPDSMLSIASDAFDYSYPASKPNFTIFGVEGSYAQEYAESKSIPFLVEAMPQLISDCEITLSQKSFEYDGEAKEPAVTVKDGDLALTAGTDYAVTYADNVEIGTAKATVTGKGGYFGSVEIAFIIREAGLPDLKDLSACEITVSPEFFSCDGTAKEPEVTVKDGGMTLAAGVDYEVAYSDNVETGTAKVTITGIGNYTGSVEKTFEIGGCTPPAPVHPNPKPLPDDDEFEMEGDGTLSKYTGTGKNVTIPSGVTGIGAGAFQGCSGITSVTLPSGVKEIGNSAFYGCSGLTEINLPEGLETIGTGAFYGCSGLTSITFPESLKNIETVAFYDCRGITGIEIPAGVENIGIRAFADCSSLAEIVVSEENSVYAGKDGCLYDKEVTTLICCPGGKDAIEIPESVTEIGISAFNGCTALQRIEISAGVETIWAGAFIGCKNLAEINVDQENGAYVSKDGCLYDKDFTTLICCPGAKDTIEIPESVTKIANDAFDNCKNLESVTLPVGVTEIGGFAFSECSGLTEIVFSESLNRIGVMAFYGCTGLAGVELPSGLTQIDAQAFDGCSGLTDIFIPKSVTSIGSLVFRDCDGLTIHGEEGSYAQTYAQENGIPFVALNGDEDLESLRQNLRQLLASLDSLKEENYTAQSWKAFKDAWDAAEAGKDTSDLDELQMLYTILQIRMAELTMNPEAQEKEQAKTDRTNALTEANKIDMSTGSQKYTAESWDVFNNAYNALNALTDEQIEEMTAEDLNALTKALTEAQAGLIKVSGKELFHCQIVCSPTSFVYDGTAKTPAVTVMDGSVTLTERLDYNVAYQDNVEIGTAKIILTGIGNYMGTVKKEFVIEAPQPKQKALSDCEVTLSPESFVYDGTAKTPAVTVKDGSKILTERTDYTVEYQDNVEAGTARVALTGIGDYTGTVTRTFEIQEALEEDEKDIADCEITLSPDTFVYDGSEKEPQVTVMDGETELRQGVDYEIFYQENIEPGTAYVTVYGEGCYVGEVTLEFTIEESPWQDEKELSSCQIVISPEVFTYDKIEKIPSVTVRDGSVTLQLNTDYSLEYDDNIDAGTAKVTLTGMGNYTGTVVRTFTIKKGAQMIDCDAVYEEDEGEDSFPLDAELDSGEGTLTYVSSNKKVVTVSTDGTVSVKGPGVATITISVAATENYEAKSIAVTVEISPRKQKMSTLKNMSGSKLRVSWKKNENATGYVVQYGTDKKFKKNTKTMQVKSYKTTSKTTPKLKKGKRYYVRVRSYKTVKVNGKNKTLYGEWSAKKNKKVKD